MGNIEQYEAKRDELMDSWIKKSRAEDGVRSFAKDGIVCPQNWFQMNAKDERILFLLKEAYDTSDKAPIWDLSKWLNGEACMPLESCKVKNLAKKCPCRVSGRSFNPIAEWTYGIFNMKDSVIPAFDSWLGVEQHDRGAYYEKRGEYLKKIAIVNIKKDDGSSSTNMQALRKYAHEYKELIKRQIELIAPTLVICCNTYDILREIYPEAMSFRVISACHPNAHKSGEEKYNLVMNEYLKL